MNDTLKALGADKAIPRDVAESIYQLQADGRTAVAFFNSPAEMIEKVGYTDDEIGRQNVMALRGHVNMDSKEWLGVWGVDKAISLLTSEGWEEGVRKGMSAFAGIDPIKLPSVRRKMRRGPVGQRLDIHRVYAGHIDEAWDVMKREGDFSSSLKKTSSTILVDVGANCDVTAEQMYWRGALANTMADALSQSGRPVRIVAYSGTSGLVHNADGKAERLIVACVVKDFTDPLELNNLYAQTALAASFRLFHLKVMGLGPYGRADSCLGYHWSVGTEMLEDFLGDGQDLTINIADIWTKQAAIEKLNDFRKQVEDPASYYAEE